MNTDAVKRFIKDNICLFWWIKKSKREDVSLNLLVQAILNYGDCKSVKRLFRLVGIKNVAKIFYKQISQKRVNYYPRTLHYFDLYFRENA